MSLNKSYDYITVHVNWKGQSQMYEDGSAYTVNILKIMFTEVQVCFVRISLVQEKLILHL